MLKNSVRPRIASFLSLTSLVEASGGCHSSALKATPTSCNNFSLTLHLSVRKYGKCDIEINKQHVIGQGEFGKCFLGAVGPNKVCIKIIKSSYAHSFYKEADILSRLCHSNVSFYLELVLKAATKC